MIPKNPDHRLSKGPLIFAALAIVFMAVWSIVHWSQMAPSIVTRQAAGNHGASRVSREVTAVAAPAALLLLTALSAAAPALQARLDKRLFSASGTPGRGSARALGAALVGLSILSSTLHVAFVGMHTGADLPVEKLVGVAVGVMLTILGVYLPLARPDGAFASRRMEAFRAAQGPAYRVAGFAMAALGAATIVIALLWPWLTIVVAPAGVLVICAGIFVKALIAAFRS